MNVSFVRSQNSTSLYQQSFDNTSIVNPQALYPFFKKLNQRESESIHIMHWGDSHIQMGYLSLELKNGIDSLYGLKGYGNIFPYKAANYNPYHSYTKVIRGKWSGGNIMKDTASQFSGYTGFWVHTKDSSAVIRFGIGKEMKFHTGNSQVTLIYKTTGNTKISVKGMNFLKDSSTLYEPVYQEFDESNVIDNLFTVSKLIFDENIDILEIDLTDNDTTRGFTLHGAVIENTNNKGVLYSSCGVGGAQFKHLIQNARVPIHQAASLGTDLFIISFGSNESYMESFSYDLYKKQVSDFILSLKKENPKSSILLTGPPDTRSKNRYPRNTALICLIFNELSSELGFAYWDLRTAMGGDGSVIKWLKSGLASKDKLHFTKEGYFLQGKWLLNAVDREYKKYNSISIK